MLRIVKTPEREIPLKGLKDDMASRVLVVSTLQTRNKVLIGCYIPIVVERTWYLSPVICWGNTGHVYCGSSDSALKANSLNHMLNQLLDEHSRSSNYRQTPLLLEDEQMRFKLIAQFNTLVGQLENNKLSPSVAKNVAKYSDLFDKDSMALLYKLGVPNG